MSIIPPGIMSPRLCSYSECTGCAACAAICPESAISMVPDIEGFLCPQVNATLCTSCGQCTSSCPILKHPPTPPIDEQNPSEQEQPFPWVYAAWHLDTAIRQQSSSGGVFTALAENVLNRGGMVVGAAYDDNFLVLHACIESICDLHRLRGSKYVQSQLSPELLHKIQDAVKTDRVVLFSGTPCQVAGLHAFLGTKHNNLLCCDLICHGVPSPFFFKTYVDFSKKKLKQLASISFRDKCTGWKNFSVVKHTSSGERVQCSMHEDPYMKAFLQNYALRRCCYLCKFTNIQRQGDITIADFWGISKRMPQYDQDDKGTSLVLVNNQTGENWLNRCRPVLFLGESNIETAIAGNRLLKYPISTVPPERESFYQYLRGHPFPALLSKYRLSPPTLPQLLILRGRRVAGIAWRRVKRIFDKKKPKFYE